MDAIFHFRQKIGCAALLSSSPFLKDLHAALENHPWFFLAPQKEAQIVWSDHSVLQAFPTQRILYTQAVDGVKMLLLDGAENALIPPDQPLGVASASARALCALLKPLNELVGIENFQVTGLFPPHLAIPSMALFYQLIPARDETLAEPLKQELTQLLGQEFSSNITCLYAPITTGPFLTLTVQTKQPMVLENLMTRWLKAPVLPSTPSTLSPDSLPAELVEKPAFIVYQDAVDAPSLRMQRESCLIGQVQVRDHQLRICVVPPDPVLSLLECSEQLVMSGAIYW